MAKDVVILIKQAGLGSFAAEDARFGDEMLERFLHTLEGMENRPVAICFYTEGIRAACEGSASLLGLKMLERLGVKLVICGTCLEKYGLKEKVQVGEVGNMKQIATLLMEADHVITV